jgi:hypothetical protein
VKVIPETRVSLLSKEVGHMAAPVSPIERHPDILALRTPTEKVMARPTVQAMDGLVFLAGLYLAASPWVLGFFDLTALAVTNVFAGVALALVAAGIAPTFGGTYGIAWVAPVIGAWAIVAPWVVSGAADTTTTITSNVAAGAVALLVGGLTAYLALRGPRH